jgi:hypothetical protein
VGWSTGTQPEGRRRRSEYHCRKPRTALQPGMDPAVEDQRLRVRTEEADSPGNRASPLFRRQRRVVVGGSTKRAPLMAPSQDTGRCNSRRHRPGTQDFPIYGLTRLNEYPRAITKTLSANDPANWRHRRNSRSQGPEPVVLPRLSEGPESRASAVFRDDDRVTRWDFELFTTTTDSLRTRNEYRLTCMTKYLRSKNAKINDGNSQPRP